MRRKLAILICSTVMIGAFAANAFLVNATDTMVSVEHSVSNVERVTSVNDLNPMVKSYYKEFVLQKDGTGTGDDSMTFSGLVPYGTGKISLGTYDMTESSNLTAPFFTILPQREWKTTSTPTEDADNRFFNVNLTSGEKSVTFRFARASGSNYTAVFAGANGNYVAGNNNNVWANSAEWPYTGLPYRYDGTVSSTSIADEHKLLIEKPVEIGVYGGELWGNGMYYLDVIGQKATENSTLTQESFSGSGTYRYAITLASSFPKFTTEELKKVEVSIEFDKETVTEEESWVMFTSIAGKKTMSDYVDEEKFFSRGDLFSLKQQTTKIDLNKKIYLGDNDGLTKLFEFETNPVAEGQSEIEQIILTLKGSLYTMEFLFVKGDQGAVGTWYTIYENANAYRYWSTQARNAVSLISAESGFENKWGKQSGYYFDGLVKHGILTENLTAFFAGETTIPRFAIYFDAKTKTFYNDFGTESDLGKTQFGDVYRWSFFSGSALNETKLGWLEMLTGERLEVSVEATLASGINSSFIKITNVDGQDLSRESVTAGDYASVYHSYVVEQPQVCDVIVGETFTIPALKDYGVLNQFAEVDRSLYVVNLNGVETAQKEFIVQKAGENVIEYFVNGESVGVVVVTAKLVDVSLLHRGASIRYVNTNETENGIRFLIAMKKSAVSKLEGYTVTAGILVAGTDNLAGEMLSIETLNNAEKKVKNIPFDIQTEWVDVMIDGVEYIQMVVYIYNIPDTDYATEITTRGYLCVDGEYIYSESVSRSMSYVAQKCVDDPNVDQATKDAVRKYIVS